MTNRNSGRRFANPCRSLTGVLAVWLFAAAACAGAQPGPLPPGRLGVYHWMGAVPHGGHSDSLSPALNDMERLGFGMARIFLGGRYDYLNPYESPRRFGGITAPVTLVKILELPRYRRFLDAPHTRTVWLTAYPVFDYGRGPDELDLRREVPEDAWKRQYAQMREVVEWLYRNYGARDKTILISNHEADEKLLEALNASRRPELAINNVARDLRTRYQAVADARREWAASSRLKVLFGPEISLCKLRIGPDARGTYAKGALGVNTLEAILPKLDFDFVSYSAWENLGENAPGAALAAAIADIRVRTRTRVSDAGRAFFSEHHVLLGEFGYAREWKMPPGAAAKVVRAATHLLRTGQVPYAVYWQLYDNLHGDVRQFGLIDAGGKLTCAAIALLPYLPTKPRQPQDTSCAEHAPRLRPALR